MHKAITILAASLSTAIATPALADDAGMDSASLTEQAKSLSVGAVTPQIGSFNIRSLNGATTSDFMATAPKMFEHGYRLSSAEDKFENQTSTGFVALLVPEEFAFRSNAQDTGVDASLPGRFLSSSARADFLPKSGPVNRGKSSLGVRFGF